MKFKENFRHDIYDPRDSTMGSHIKGHLGSPIPPNCLMSGAYN